jgi:hypothetical protein
MTEPESQDDQNKTGQKSAESALVQDVGTHTADHAAHITNEPNAEQQPANKLGKFRVKIWESVAWYWESLKGKGKSNRMIAVATFVIAIAGGATWWEAYNAGEQTDRIIAADERSASAIESAVGQANVAFSGTVEESRLDQRAWLGVEDIPVGAPVGGVFWAMIHVKNSGKTPAVQFRHVGEVKPLDHIPDVSLDCKKAMGIEMKEIITPQGIKSIPIDGTAFGVVHDKWDEQWPGMHIYVHECSLYTDIFKQHHWLTYCGRYNGKLKAFDDCETGNDTGDGDGPDKK